MNDIFDKIIAKEIPAHFVYEDDICIVIMDKFPVIAGQVLIIPKVHTDYYFDLDEKTALHLHTITKKIAVALDTVYDTLRTCVTIEGFEVPHVHIKLFPRTSPSSVTHGASEAKDEDIRREAEKIKRALSL